MRDKKEVLITGTSSGFGLMASLSFAKAGYHVIATMRDLRKQNQLVQLAETEGLTELIEIVQLDVNEGEQASEKVRQIIESVGRIDVLVNNAGYAAGGFIEDIPLDEWKRQFDTNFFGIVSVTNAVLPFMRKQKSGMILNISSISGRVAFPGMGPYVASKFAVEGYSETLRLEMKKYGIHVVLIEPGSYKTDIWEKSLAEFTEKPNSAYKSQLSSMLGQVKQISKGAGDPEEVSKLMVKVADTANPSLRYPIGKGVKASVRLKNTLPWKWIEKIITKQIDY
ncbi:SDR family oxidoreductase [Pseudalkalibacillus caeni]|uniref:SDR family oxidoreductase n=1 Tax=Exobacillus caeni TaxID=2574798 RepID=A0A5R9FF33_9BACL|nr:SDR family oxidoreductase [Pseudalkalibacillus caeni]TLS38185.1 SDR family oxidoreductase [Pseudalkalibacillus caeni]